MEILIAGLILVAIVVTIVVIRKKSSSKEIPSGGGRSVEGGTSKGVERKDTDE
jgi:preprotein translocase subunit SecG